MTPATKPIPKFAGMAVDAVKMLIRIALPEVGVGIDDARVLRPLKVVTDEGVGADAAKILVSLYTSDTGIGTDALEIIKRIIPYLKKKYPYLEKEYPHLKKKYPYLHKGKIVK